MDNPEGDERTAAAWQRYEQSMVSPKTAWSAARDNDVAELEKQLAAGADLNATDRARARLLAGPHAAGQVVLRRRDCDAERGCSRLGAVGAQAHHDHRRDADYDSPAGALFRRMSESQRSLLTDNIARALGRKPEGIQQRQLAHFTKADPEYGARVRQALAEQHAIAAE